MSPGIAAAWHPRSRHRAKFWLGLLSLVLPASRSPLLSWSCSAPPPLGPPPRKLADQPELVLRPQMIAVLIAWAIYVFTLFAVIIKRCHDRGRSGWCGAGGQYLVH